MCIRDRHHATIESFDSKKKESDNDALNGQAEDEDAEMALCGAYIEEMNLTDEDEVSPNEYYMMSTERKRKREKATHTNAPSTTTTTDVGTTVQVQIISNSNNKTSRETINALIDTGCSRTIVKRSALTNVAVERIKEVNETHWEYSRRQFATQYDVHIEFALVDCNIRIVKTNPL